MFDLEPEEARLLLDIALLATGQNRFGSAEKILSALRGYRPQSESLSVAEAVLMLSRGDTGEALDFIDRELRPDRFPDSAMLAAFKGLALIRAERLPEARAALAAAAAAEDRDPAAAQLAKELLK